MYLCSCAIAQCCSKSGLLQPTSQQALLYTAANCPLNVPPAGPTTPVILYRAEARGHRHPGDHLLHLLPYPFPGLHVGQPFQAAQRCPGLPPGWHGLQQRRGGSQPGPRHAQGECGWCWAGWAWCAPRWAEDCLVSWVVALLRQGRARSENLCVRWWDEQTV
jgi:hypothetical protein